MKEGEAKIFFNKIFSISTYWILLKVHFELFAHIQSSHLTFGRTKADGIISILQVKKKMNSTQFDFDFSFTICPFFRLSTPKWQGLGVSHEHDAWYTEAFNEYFWNS